MASSEEAAATAAAALLAAGNEAPEGESGSEGANEGVEFPSFDVEIPADIAALLEEDDTDLSVTEEELDALSEETGNEEVPREILARLRAAEKRSEHLEKLRVNESRKNWSEEAERIFPLAAPFLTEINATSRRGFLRTARDLHVRMVPLVEDKVLKPAREAIETERQKAALEGKETARAAWGQAPTSDEAPSEARVTLEATRARRRRGEFSDTVREMLYPKKEAE